MVEECHFPPPPYPPPTEIFVSHHVDHGFLVGTALQPIPCEHVIELCDRCRSTLLPDRRDDDEKMAEGKQKRHRPGPHDFFGDNVVRKQDHQEPEGLRTEVPHVERYGESECVVLGSPDHDCHSPTHQSRCRRCRTP